MSAEPTVRWAELDGPASDSLAALLSPDERERAESLRFARDRERFTAARGLMRALLGDRLGLDPARIAFVYDEAGKPRLAEGDLRFNLSHSAGLVAVAICEGREVGIDVEAIREDLFAEGIARRYLPAEMAAEIGRRSGSERTEAFFRAWVRQEAYAKARGGGLELIGEAPDPAGWTVIDLELAPGYAAALAIEGGGSLHGGEQLVADLARVRDAGVELHQVVHLIGAGTAEPVS